MDKMIRKEVISFIISITFMWLSAVFFSTIPLFSDTYTINGTKAIAGLIILLFVLLLIPMNIGNIQDKCIYPIRFCHDCFCQVLFNLDQEVELKKITQKERQKYAEDYSRMCVWLYNFRIFYGIYFLINIVSIFIIGILIMKKSFLDKKITFSIMYGYTAFFFLMIYIWFNIISRHLLKSYLSWLKNKELKEWNFKDNKKIFM